VARIAVAAYRRGVGASTGVRQRTGLGMSQAPRHQGQPITPVSRHPVVSAPSARACGCSRVCLSGPLDVSSASGATGADTGALIARLSGTNARKQYSAYWSLGSPVLAFSQRHVNTDSGERYRRGARDGR
jgi:hypothetical protein